MRDDHPWPPGRPAAEGAEEEALRRLLGEAGARPALDEDDVAELTAATRRALGERFGAPAGAAPPPRPGWRARRVWLPLAAALLVALGLGSWWMVSRGGVSPVVARVEATRGAVAVGAGPREGSPLAAGEAVERGTLVCASGTASGAALRLAGGAELRLAGESCLRLVAGDEVALERGGVFADTGGVDGVGLAVHTPFGTVRDVGTRFAVRLLDDAVAVRVRDGAVLVAGRHRAGPGEELLVGRDGRVERRAVRSWSADWEWAPGAAGFVIEGRTLAELLAWAAAENGWTLRYADPGLEADAREIVLHGDLGELRPDEAPFAVLPGAGLEGRLDDGVLVVSRPGDR
jgi:hypothetical protein